MAKISGIAFILIGILFSVSSVIINNVQNTNSLTIFIYIGYLFIGYGVSKLVVAYVVGKGKEVENAFNQELPEQSRISEQDKKKSTHGDLKSKLKNSSVGGYLGNCKRCNTPMMHLNRYCHRCGLRQESIK